MELRPKTPSTKGPDELFRGEVYFDQLAKGEDMRVNIVRFSPGAHTAWHKHLRGQTLHVVDGVGLVQARGGQVIRMRAGDTVYTPPGEWHWHGATPEDFMAHLAMWEGDPESDEPETTWGEHVADAEYDPH